MPAPPRTPRTSLTDDWRRPFTAPLGAPTTDLAAWLGTPGAAERLAELQRLTERVSAALTADDVLRAAADDVARAVGAARAVAFVERLADGRLEPLDERGAPDDERDAFAAFAALAAEAARRGEPVVEGAPGATLVAFPVGGGAGTRDAVALALRPPRALGDDERRLLLAAGRIAGQGAARARAQSLREEERRRLARELHDEFGQALTGLKLDLAWLERQLADLPAADLALAEAVRGMARRVDETVDAVRRIASRLRPAVLDDLGLVAALEWQANELERRAGVRCALALDDVAVAEPQATALFRVAQEALTNVARHARARRVWVTLSARAGAITLRVRDDGVGLGDAPGAGLGVVGMRERAAALGGTVRVGAADGGTEVTLTLPSGAAPHGAAPHGASPYGAVP